MSWALRTCTRSPDPQGWAVERPREPVGKGHSFGLGRVHCQRWLLTAGHSCWATEAKARTSPSCQELQVAGGQPAPRPVGHLLLQPLSVDAVRMLRGVKGRERTSRKLSSHSRCSFSLGQVKMNLRSGVTMVRPAFQRFPRMPLGRSSYTWYPCSFLPRKTWPCSKASSGFL